MTAVKSAVNAVQNGDASVAPISLAGLNKIVPSEMPNGFQPNGHSLVSGEPAACGPLGRLNGGNGHASDHINGNPLSDIPTDDRIPVDGASCRCATCMRSTRLPLHNEMMVAEWSLLKGDKAEPSGALLLSTGRNASAIGEMIIAMGERWVADQPMIQMADYGATYHASGTPRPMAEQLDGACMALAASRHRSHDGQGKDAAIPAWLIVDLLDLAPGLSVELSADDGQSVGMSGLNWLEQLEVFVWQRLRSDLAPRVLLLAQPSQQDEITNCLRQLASLRGVPFYVAGPLDSTGRVLTPDVWQPHVASAIVGLLWPIDSGKLVAGKSVASSSIPAGELFADAGGVSNAKRHNDRTVYALGGAAQFAPMEPIKEWLAMRMVQSLVEVEIGGHGTPPSLTDNAVGSNDSQARVTAESDDMADDVPAKAARPEQSTQGMALSNLSDVGEDHLTLGSIPLLSVELMARESKIQVSVPDNEVAVLTDYWRYARKNPSHLSKAPSKELLMEVQQEQLPLSHMQYQARRSWLVNQMSLWERELYLWSGAVLRNSGDGPGLATYESGLQSIWQALLQVATVVEEKLAKAGEEVGTTQKTLFAEMENVDNTCHRWATAVEKLGFWRFVRPDYGWLWSRTRTSILPREIGSLSDAFAAYNDAKLVEANLHVLRQLCLAQMQDIRSHLHHAEALTVWFTDLRVFLAKSQADLEESMGEPWREGTLEQLWRGLQTTEVRTEQGAQLNAFLRHKPLTEWLRQMPVEITHELTAWIGLGPLELTDASVVDLLAMADAGSAGNRGSMLEDLLELLVAQSEPLWPKEHLAGSESSKRTLLTSPPSVSQEFTADSLDALQDGLAQETVEDAKECFTDAAVATWCNSRTQMEWSESQVNGLVAVGQAATDLEGLWL